MASRVKIFWPIIFVFALMLVGCPSGTTTENAKKHTDKPASQPTSSDNYLQYNAINVLFEEKFLVSLHGNTKISSNDPLITNEINNILQEHNIIGIYENGNWFSIVISADISSDQIISELKKSSAVKYATTETRIKY
ncbi:hypothetical protein D3C87_1220380 [compost metagenome]